MATPIKMNDEQFMEMKDRINRLLIDNNGLIQMNADLRTTIVALKVDTHRMKKWERITSGIEKSVPLPDLGIDVLKDLIAWFDKPNQSPLGDIVERARLTIKTIEDNKSSP